MHADYVIVGAGSAGCAMAYRLAEAGRRVTVIEHGGSDAGPFIQMPGALSYPMNMGIYDWGFATEPEPHLGGRVLATRIESRQAGLCPRVPGRGIEHYTRAEFNRLALAQPCVLNESAAGEVRVGLVTLRVESWETPHNRRLANVGRLYRGMFIDRELKKDMDIEIEADQLGSCE